MAIKDSLVKILACPEDQGPLLYSQQDALFYNPRLKKQYKIVDGIPVMLPEEAVTLTQEAHDKLMSRIETQEGTSSTTAL